MNTPLPPAEDPDDESLAAGLSASRVLQEAPEDLVLQAINLWQRPPRAAATDKGPGRLRQLVATLVFDSLDHPLAAAGRRSDGTLGHLAARQLLFSVEGRDIDLRLAPQEDGSSWVLSGQVLGPDRSGRAELRPEGAAVQAVDWNELAEFEFEPIGAGLCGLILSSDDWSVELRLYVRSPTPADPGP